MKIVNHQFVYRLADHDDPARLVAFSQPTGRACLIKLDMPELEHEGEFERRRTQVYVVHVGCWRPGILESRMALDGRGKISWDDDSRTLSVHRTCRRALLYWQVGEEVRESHDGDEDIGVGRLGDDA